MQRHIWENISLATLYILINQMKKTKQKELCLAAGIGLQGSTQLSERDTHGEETMDKLREINESQKSNLTCRALKTENQIVKTEVL